jgi:hypothetical protein
MLVYKDVESLFADGIIEPRQRPPCVEIMQREFVNI